jgi:hypothetical protein
MSTILTLTERVSHHFTDPTPTAVVFAIGWIIAFAGTSLMLSVCRPE